MNSSFSTVMNYCFASAQNRQYLFFRLIIIFIAVVISISIYINNSVLQQKAAPAVFSDSPAQIIVKVGGAVKYPGIFQVPANAMAESVIKMAMIDCDNAEHAKPAGCNQQLDNGCAIDVSLNGKDMVDVTVALMSVKQRLVLGIPLDINKMGLEDFSSVPGIGPGLAKTILAYRQSVGGKMAARDLANVSGIGDNKYNKLVKYFNRR